MGLEGIELGDRELLENVVSLLLAGLPAGWARLHAECVPPAVEALVTMADGQSQPVAASEQVMTLLAEHRHRSAERGTPWRRLVIDCDANGQLSAYADPPVASSGRGPRLLLWALTALAVCLLTVAGVVFAVDWRWGPPPRVPMAALPAPPPRQEDALKVIHAWLDAENRADVAALRAQLCADPSPAVLTWIDTLARFGPNDGITYPDAVTGFRDEGQSIWVQLAVRLRPGSESQKQAVERTQTSGGFFDDAFTLVEEAGQLKVCDISGITE